MPLNRPTVTTSRISFGPARVFIGASGTTPSVDIGAIRTDDGVTVELKNETRDIEQGNPKLIEYTFSQAQGAMIKVTSIEWDYTNLAYGIGSGVTASGGGTESLVWGGDPIVSTVALHVQHQMPVSGNTLDLYVWKAVSEAPPSLPFTHDEHAFELSFKAQLSTTDWAGTTLNYRSQLFKLIETD